jgi:hypothetical protein
LGIGRNEKSLREAAPWRREGGRIHYAEAVIELQLISVKGRKRMKRFVGASPKCLARKEIRLRSPTKTKPPSRGGFPSEVLGLRQA